jgi:flavin-dependent dehydrogenase
MAIVGGGPGGALAASILAAGGRNVLLFDEHLAWEKPCGGGLTHKALEQYPFLLQVPGKCKQVEHCEITSPSGRRVVFDLQRPVAIFSRLALNGLLLERARGAGANVIRERVTRIGGRPGNWRLTTPAGEYVAARLLLAAGARNGFRAQFLSPISPEDLMVTAGYFIPSHDCPDAGSQIQIQFLRELTGYIWVFPRPDHVSAGIAGKMGEVATAKLRGILEGWLAKNLYRWEGARFYSHILPSFRETTLATLRACGEGWATIGDSAGLVDPITGEGLYYALRSAELYAEAQLRGRPDDYQSRLEDEILSELRVAARLSERFYRGQIFGSSVLEQMVELTANSGSFRRLMSDLFAGTQGYTDLRARLSRMLPAVMGEGLASKLGWPPESRWLAGRSSTELA